MKGMSFIIFIFFCSCSFISSKKENVNYSNRFKIYHYSKLDLPNEKVCLEIKETVLSIVSKNKDYLDEFNDECSLYIDVKSKRRVNNSFRYLAYIDFDNFIKEFQKRYGKNENQIFLNINSDDDIARSINSTKNSKFIFFQDNPNADGSIVISSKFSKIETSVGEIYGVNLEAQIFKDNKLIEIINTTGYGTKQDALQSATNELLSKLDKVSEILKPDYIFIEFSNIKSTNDFFNIYNFFSKKHIRFDILQIKNNTMVLKISFKKSIEEISSQILSMIEKSAIEKIDPENKKIFIMLNYSDVGIL